MKLLKTFLFAGVLGFAASALAEEAAAPVEPGTAAGAEAAVTAAPAATTAATPAAAPVEVSATGDHVVKVNTGNETVDAAANLASKCAERTAAFKTCDSMGGFKAMGCRKMAELRYKDVQCPL